MQAGNGESGELERAPGEGGTSGPNLEKDERRKREQSVHFVPPPPCQRVGLKTLMVGG